MLPKLDAIETKPKTSRAIDVFLKKVRGRVNRRECNCDQVRVDGSRSMSKARTTKANQQIEMLRVGALGNRLLPGVRKRFQSSLSAVPVLAVAVCADKMRTSSVGRRCKAVCLDEHGRCIGGKANSGVILSAGRAGTLGLVGRQSIVRDQKRILKRYDAWEDAKMHIRVCGGQS